MEKVLDVQDFNTCQITQAKELCGHVILTYKIYQVISWGVITTDISVRRNYEEKTNDQLLVHV